MKDEINAAISAHGEWKDRLVSAIETGTSDFVPEVVSTDNNCAFGKWFYGLQAPDNETEDYKEIKDLHARFHKAAANVLQTALAGRKDDAFKLFEVGGEFSKSSSALILALGRWRNKNT